MKKILFIDRDGTIVKEAPPSYQIDSFSKLEFYPEVFKYLGKIATEFDFELAMVTNQDGLGTGVFTEEVFWPVHQFIMKAFENEGIHFSSVLIDRSFPKDHSPNRKPGIGIIKDYLENEEYDISNSFVIGDRITDVQFAKNMGCKAIWLNNDSHLGGKEISDTLETLQQVIALETTQWAEVYSFLKLHAEDEG